MKVPGGLGSGVLLYAECRRAFCSMSSLALSMRFSICAALVAFFSLRTAWGQGEGQGWGQGEGWGQS